MTAVSPVDLQLRDAYWHLLGHRSELARPGSFVRLSWLNDDVVAYLDGESIVVFDNVCPHRGARLLDGEHGVAPLVCRYHGWAYRGGRVRVPPGSGLSAEVCEGVDLSRLQSAWCGEWLFASVNPCMALPEQLAGVHDELAALSATIDRRLDFNAYPYECAWQVAVENALEPYHIAAVHPQSLGELKLATGENSLHPWSSVWRASIEDERSDRRLKRIRRLFAAEPPFEGYASYYLFPFSMISTTYGYSYSVQNFLPSAVVGRTNFVSRLYVARASAAEFAATLTPFFESTAAFNRRVFEEDHAICQRVHPQAWSRRADALLTESEVKVRQFRALWDRASGR